ncbi:unnamed protein product [Rotaria sordida]|uniref:Reverse transcriptase domain-containing protein n=1 Tax=Rotaria sordida TaxID=392033 RepID=A0A815CLW0_9BILA|nr:unnamed protein product [Rotaria sordida]
MYIQHNGVAMGAPLASVIADIFMTYLEITLMDKLTQLGVCEWYRYVDDTFVFINKDANVDNLLSIVNEFHPSIKFTRKIEDNDKLEFLNVHVIRSPEQQCSETTIYRRPTFTELLTNWNSYVPIQYKKVGIVSIVNRALNICSTCKLLEDEFNKIRRFGLYNNYPVSFIDTIIGIKLNQHRNKMITELDKPIIEKTKRKNKEIEEEEKTKRIKMQRTQSSLTDILWSSHKDFYGYVVDGNLYNFEIDWVSSNDNDYFNDRIKNYIKDYLNELSSLKRVYETDLQKNFNDLIANLLNAYDDSTLLQYKNTVDSSYLESKYSPDCTFIFKNIDVSNECLQDFVVCLGELKCPDQSMTETKCIGQLLQYLRI